MKRLLPLLLVSSLHAGFVPDFKLKPDLCNVLMAYDAKLSEGLNPLGAGTHGKLYVDGWRNPDQQARWEITNTQAADYAVQVLIAGPPNLRIEVSAAGNTLKGQIPADGKGWQRILLPDLVMIPEGASAVTLRLLAADGTPAFGAQVHAVEMVRPTVRPTVRTDMQKRAAEMRADTAWFQKARYGIMVTWTNQSMPRHGEPKPYAQAVADFDVSGFADQMECTGAGLVVMATSHAYQYFPAPLESLDKILAGRTGRRDLENDFSDGSYSFLIRMFRNCAFIGGPGCICNAMTPRAAAGATRWSVISHIGLPFRESMIFGPWQTMW